MINFKIINLDIRQSYFFGKVERNDEEFKINIQNERRGKVLRLPFGIIPKKERRPPPLNILQEEQNLSITPKVDSICSVAVALINPTGSMRKKINIFFSLLNQ